MPNIPELKSRFNELIESMGCTKTDAARAIGIPYATFSSISSYGAVPKPITLMKIADYFNITIEYLIGRTDDEYFEKAKEPQTFHIRLNELREEENITFYELAKRLYLSSNYTTEWSKNEMVPYLDNLELIAGYFKVSIDYLLGRTDERNV